MAYPEISGRATLCQTCYGGRVVYEYIGLPMAETIALAEVGLMAIPRIVQQVTRPCPDCCDKRGVPVGVVVRD